MSSPSRESDVLIPVHPDDLATAATSCGEDGPAPAAASDDAGAQDGIAERSTSRRGLFRLGTALAAASAALIPAADVSAQRVVRPRARRPKAPQPSDETVLLLVRRITNGVTAAELELADRLGFRAYLDYHLDPTSIDDSAVQSFVSTTWPSMSLEGQGLYQQNQNQLLRQLTEASLYRAAFSKRQLYERMVEFWSDHFNIYYPKVNYLKVLDERVVIRAHALGTFPDMLRASAHSPAMLEYLDNTRSRGSNVNQNYARELMELHTLGVDGGYTQTDVEEVTRCLTGWTIQGRGQFRFDPSGHDFTVKTVLGVTIPSMPANAGAAGVQDGEMVLDILLEHPSTARFIATKMTRWLLRYDPPENVIDDVADTFTRTDGDIPSMIRTILTPANLLAAAPKYKQPYQLVLSTLRATQPSVRGVVNIANAQLRNLGQQLFLWEEPDGYPDDVEWWAGSILQRWNYCSYIANLSNVNGEVVVSVASLMLDNSPEGITEAINQRAFAGLMSSDLASHVREYLAGATINEVRVREALALALSSTEFQWY